MSKEPWQVGFANTNANIAELLNGSMAKPWWPLIPPKDWIESSISDITE